MMLNEMFQNIDEIKALMPNRSKLLKDEISIIKTTNQKLISVTDDAIVSSRISNENEAILEKFRLDMVRLLLVNNVSLSQTCSSRLKLK